MFELVKILVCAAFILSVVYLCVKEICKQGKW